MKYLVTAYEDRDERTGNYIGNKKQIIVECDEDHIWKETLKQCPWARGIWYSEYEDKPIKTYNIEYEYVWNADKKTRHREMQIKANNESQARRFYEKNFKGKCIAHDGHINQLGVFVEEGKYTIKYGRITNVEISTWDSPKAFDATTY